MARSLEILAAQVAPLQITAPLSDFAAHALRTMEAHPQTQLLIYPELHLFADGTPDAQRESALRAAAEPLDGPRVQALLELASELGVWLIPGSVCELGENGELFNTLIVLSPAGELVASYRKIFPWRPHEPYNPGAEFVTVDLPEFGRLGLNICYDAWFPEVCRQLAWMGAEAIINVVKTTTADRAQELILAQANAIVNQVFMVSVNCATSPGVGQSIIVGPEGEIITQADGENPQLLPAHLDFDEVTRVRAEGTAGVNRPWAQFREGERPIELPIYGGRIDPKTWEPR